MGKGRGQKSPKIFGHHLWMVPYVSNFIVHLCVTHQFAYNFEFHIAYPRYNNHSYSDIEKTNGKYNLRFKREIFRPGLCLIKK